MDINGKLFEVAGEKAYVMRGIFDFFDEKNFTRLLAEYEEAKKYGAKFYVGLYTNDLMERTHKERKLKNIVTDQDRVNLLEAVDFVDGAFLIPELRKNGVRDALELKMLRQRTELAPEEPPMKKYEIGYASGAFSNLHKGHVEHLKMMSEQCKTVIVAANSDELIQNYKHKNASVNEDMRRLILSHIKYVDMAIITNDYDKLKAIERVRELCGESFNAIFAGSDWKGDPKWIDFEKRLAEMGIDVVFTDRPENGISTTAIDKTKKARKKVKPEAPSDQGEAR